MKKPIAKKNDSHKKGGLSKMPEPARVVAIAKRPASPAALKLAPPPDLFNRMQQLYDSISRRAFQIFENKGQIFGQDLEDWFKAESELLHPVHMDVSESDGNLTVKAEVPGFTAKELKVAVEPRRVTITGKRETREERKDKKTLYTETCSDQVLRVIDLPTGVDTGKAVATLKDGMLELRMPKAAPARKLEIVEKGTNRDEQC
jgi:HSP20 family protein